MNTIEPIRVRYGETDQMGHVYYANYLYWFEQARGRFCRDRGFTYKSLEGRGMMLPVVEAHLRYRAEVTYDEDVQVEIWISEIKRSSLRFDYKVTRQDGKLATEGYTWHVLMGAARTAISIPDDVREMLLRPVNSLPND